MEAAWNIVEIVFGVLCAIGWIIGAVAWAQRGFVIPKPVHTTAVALFVAGCIIAAVVYSYGIGSYWFTACVLVCSPAWVCAGWFLMGCPNGDKEQGNSAYDISTALMKKTKGKWGTKQRRGTR